MKPNNIRQRLINSGLNPKGIYKAIRKIAEESKVALVKSRQLWKSLGYFNYTMYLFEEPNRQRKLLQKKYKTLKKKELYLIK